MKYVSLVSVIIAAGCLFITGCFSGGGGGSSDAESLSGISIGAFVSGTFQPGRLNLSTTSTTNLSQGETITVTATVVDAYDNYYMEELNVIFSSSFADKGLAGLSSTLVTTSNGIAETTYWGAGGDGTDTITASIVIDGKTLVATGTVNVSAPDVAHLEFISTSADVIALKNTGGPGRPETAVLVFKVLDDYGYASANQTIDFELSTDIGNLYLSNTSDVSDLQGLVQTTVNAGTVSTHIRVKATIRGSSPEISIVSDELLISTGLPDQNSVSLSPETFNPEAWAYNNVEVPIIFQAADHFNNFVPDGTVVYFTTGQGSIDDHGIVIDGVCEVNWRSGSPRSTRADNVFPPGLGRVPILAFTIGEESFTDTNGNGFFDAGDTFITTTDVAEPFRDDDFDGIRDSSDPWWDYNNNGQYDGTPNGIYNGSLCSASAESQGLCSRELVYAQASIELIMSGSFATIGFSPATVQLSATGQTVLISIADENNNPMPSDSEVTIKTTIGSIIGPTNFNIGSTNKSGPLVYSVVLVPKEDEKKTSGYMEVTIQTPFGNVSTAYLSVTASE